MSYCDADLKKYFANIDQYDLKKTLSDEWVVHSEAVDKYADCGSVTKLYRNGVDLGTAKGALGSIAADGDWYYDSAADLLYCQNTNEANTYEFQVSPLSWADAKTAAISDGAKWLESMLDGRFPRPLPKNNDGTYDFILQRANGLLACILLIRSTDPTDSAAGQLLNELFNDAGNGMLDLLNAGKIKLGFEVSREGAILSDGALNSATTGYITDIQGTPNVAYDKFKVLIGASGTLTTGTENTTITYTVTDSQGDLIHSAEYIDGYYQPLGGGIYGRFVPGVYTSGDYWFITVTGYPNRSATTGQIKVVRR